MEVVRKGGSRTAQGYDRRSPASHRARSIHTARGRREKLVVWAGRAELDVTGVLIGDDGVARRQVAEIAGRQDLFPIGARHAHPALKHVSPMRAGAAVVRQTLEEWRGVGASRIRDDRNALATPIDAADAGSMRAEEDREVVSGRVHGWS